MNTNLSLPFSCEDGHDFEMAGEGYYKNDEVGNRIPQVVFRMIYCLKCGENLEIIVADRRPTKQIDFTMSDLQKEIIRLLEKDTKNAKTRTRRNRKSNARNDRSD